MTEQEIEKMLDLLESEKLENLTDEQLNKLIERVSEEADKEAYQLAGEYNIRDTEIINQLDEKLKLMDLVLALAYDAKLNYVDAYTSVRMWDVITHNYLMDHKIVVPQYKYDGKPFSFEGGHVKEPYIGEHKWVCSFDLNSLYPHLIMQYNISPDTFLGMWDHFGLGVDAALDGSYDEIREDLLEKNVTVTPNGCIWSKKEQGFLPALMEKMYLDRKSFKKKMIAEKKKFEETGDEKHTKAALRFDMIQMAKKIQLNSAYGALGNAYFRWFNYRYAESITLGGQLSIRWIEGKLNTFLNKKFKTKDVDYVVASDTDSVYLVLDKAVQIGMPEGSSDEKITAYLDKVCSKLIEPFIDKSYQELADYACAFQQKMIMKREAIASKAIWRGKKMYILNVYNNEGVQYHEPVLKIMGIEAVRSSTPQVVREKIKDALKIIMNGTQDELIEFVADFKKEFDTLPFEKVAMPRSLNNMNKYGDPVTVWKKGTPIQVRGAFVYNQLIKKHKLEKKLTPLRDGDKIKFSYMVVPNPTHENVLSVLDELPKEFKMDQYIDRDAQFEKSFTGPLKGITDAIDWELEKTISLEDFFG